MSKTQVIQDVQELQTLVSNNKSIGASIGFVPTMGALHPGHLSLVKKAMEENDVVIACIFVNPKQFNNAVDLKNYPRTPEKDIELLETTGIHVVFLPTESAIYPEDYSPPQFDLGQLDKVMEGQFRPGHFQGVVNVVHRLFTIVKPTRAYFGKKDFQQVAIIKHFSKTFHPTIQITEMPTLRDQNGLALSSRNMLLTVEQKTDAIHLYQALVEAKQLAKTLSPIQVLAKIEKKLTNDKFHLEYAHIVDPAALSPLKEEWTPGATLCLAAYFGNVRLIDNMTIIDN